MKDLARGPSLPLTAREPTLKSLCIHEFVQSLHVNNMDQDEYDTLRAIFSSLSLPSRHLDGEVDSEKKPIKSVDSYQGTATPKQQLGKHEERICNNDGLDIAITCLFSGCELRAWSCPPSEMDELCQSLEGRWKDHDARDTRAKVPAHMPLVDFWNDKALMLLCSSHCETVRRLLRSSQSTAPMVSQSRTRAPVTGTSDTDEETGEEDPETKSYEATSGDDSESDVDDDHNTPTRPPAARRRPAAPYMHHQTEQRVHAQTNRGKQTITDYFAARHAAAPTIRSPESDSRSPTSVFTATPSSVFDRTGSPRYRDTPDTTPGSDFSGSRVSRTLFRPSSGIKFASPTTRANLPYRDVGCQTSSPEDETLYDEYFASRVVESYDGIIDAKKLNSSRRQSSGRRDSSKACPLEVLQTQDIHPYNEKIVWKNGADLFFRQRSSLYSRLQDLVSGKLDINKPGKVYVLVDDVDPTLRGCFKVGFTDTGVCNRYKNGCPRRFNFKFVAVSKHTFAGAKAVEQLVHADLYQWHREIKCAYCKNSKGHYEWFQTDFATVMRSVNRWKMFVSLAGHYGRTEWSEMVMEHLRQQYSSVSHRLVSSLWAEDTTLPQHRSLVTFVDVGDDDLLIRSKAKDRFEVGQFEALWNLEEEKVSATLRTRPASLNVGTDERKEASRPVQTLRRAATFFHVKERTLSWRKGGHTKKEEPETEDAESRPQRLARRVTDLLRAAR
ncbi:hypothetical protein O9K51_08210 [Purpureocillium lavendulum]|uniref:Bacteriophage T5 Orf172 DNA-binding domain-containing protein n=1 Tax=Purpureocillium lavendulum TaxID=1247861 RepID=A0AB34FID0_9HYPO|nr:hypothetical protein O9K51_08210 [Purpureocillium lavendulum]